MPERQQNKVHYRKIPFPRVLKLRQQIFKDHSLSTLCQLFYLAYCWLLFTCVWVSNIYIYVIYFRLL